MELEEPREGAPNLSGSRSKLLVPLLGSNRGRSVSSSLCLPGENLEGKESSKSLSGRLSGLLGRRILERLLSLLSCLASFSPPSSSCCSSLPESGLTLSLGRRILDLSSCVATRPASARSRSPVRRCPRLMLHTFTTRPSLRLVRRSQGSDTHSQGGLPARGRGAPPYTARSVACALVGAGYAALRGRVARRQARALSWRRLS